MGGLSLLVSQIQTGDPVPAGTFPVCRGAGLESCFLRVAQNLHGVSVWQREPGRELQEEDLEAGRVPEHSGLQLFVPSCQICCCILL